MKIVSGVNINDESVTRNMLQVNATFYCIKFL